MAKTFQRDKFCDFKIIVGETIFSVHRSVLITYSKYFRAMFDNDFMESKQEFREAIGIAEEAVKQCIDYIYGESLKLHIDNVSDVIKVSLLWQLDEATENCIEFLKSNLGLQSCISTKKIAKLYDFNELEQDCDDFIIHNLKNITNDNHIADLDKNDIIKIMGQDEVLDVKSLWEFCSTWAEKKCSVCDMFASFPIPQLTTDQFKSLVWSNVHITSCGSCKSNLALTFLKKLQYDLDRGFQFEIHNCLFVKELVTNYPLHNIKQIVDRFIMTNIREVIKQYAFLQISTDDFLYYMSEIDVDMKKDEFPFIVNWIRFDKKRHNAFPKIFLVTSSQSGQKWNILVEHCFFVKSMALKFDCKEIGKAVDAFMVKKFAQITKEEEFLSLDGEVLKSYLSSEEIYQCDEKIIWNAMNRWINSDPNNRLNLFPDIFDSLILDKFSNEFLRNIICEDKRIKQHVLCSTKLMELLLNKVDMHETKIQNQSEDIKRLQKTLGNQHTEIQNQSKEIISLQKTLGDQNTKIQNHSDEMMTQQQNLLDQNMVIQNQAKEVKILQRKLKDQNNKMKVEFRKLELLMKTLVEENIIKQDTHDDICTDAKPSSCAVM